MATSLELPNRAPSCKEASTDWVLESFFSAVIVATEMELKLKSR